MILNNIDSIKAFYLLRRKYFTVSYLIYKNNLFKSFNLFFVFFFLSTSRSNKSWIGNAQKFSLWLPQTTSDTTFSGYLVSITHTFQWYH